MERKTIVKLIRNYEVPEGNIQISQNYCSCSYSCKKKQTGLWDASKTHSDTESKCGLKSEEIQNCLMEYSPLFKNSDLNFK